jgi:hypothetical protein
MVRPPLDAPSSWLQSAWTGPIHAVRLSLCPSAHGVPGCIHLSGCMHWGWVQWVWPALTMGVRRRRSFWWAYPYPRWVVVFFAISCPM